MRCPSCNHDSPADASFCEECGAKLELICPACKASVSLGARFCKKCGTAIGPRKAATSTTLSSTKSQIIVAADSAASEAIEGERKTVTALFADIRGSTELMEDLDPEEARAIIDPALKLMIDAAHRYDGYVVQSTGDGIFARFGAPVADEDHPQRALYAALRMQEELKRYSAKVVADGGVPIEARIGVNTGEVVVRSIMTGDGHTEYTPIGHTANLASRMQAIAPTGSIAITEHTRRLVEGYFQLKGRGPTRVKGLSEAVNVYEVTGLGPLRTRLQVLGIDSHWDAHDMPATQDDLQHGWHDRASCYTRYFHKDRRVADWYARGRRVHLLARTPEDLPPPGQRAHWDSALLRKLAQRQPATLPARQHPAHLVCSH